MGTSTPNFNMYLAARNEFVDVNLDWNNNLDIIDHAYFVPNVRVIRQPFDNTIFPETQMGIKGFSTYDNDFKFWDGRGWHSTDASVVDWIPLGPKLINGWVVDPSNPAFYRIAPTDERYSLGGSTGYRVEFDGNIMLGNHQAVPQGVYSIMTDVSIHPSKFGSWATATNGSFRNGIPSGVFNTAYWVFGNNGNNVQLQMYGANFPDGDVHNSFAIKTLTWIGT